MVFLSSVKFSRYNKFRIAAHLLRHSLVAVALLQLPHGSLNLSNSPKFEMVGLSGLEPLTSRLSGVRSNQLSYRPICGGDEENRTPDPLLARQVLSQLSYAPT